MDRQAAAVEVVRLMSYSSYSAMESWAHERRPVCPVTHIFILMMTPQKTAIFATMSTPIPKQSSIIFLVLSDLWNLSSEWGKLAGLCGCADLACRSKVCINSIGKTILKDHIEHCLVMPLNMEIKTPSNA